MTFFFLVSDFVFVFSFLVPGFELFILYFSFGFLRSGGSVCWSGSRAGFMGSFGFIRGFVWPPIYPVCGLKYGNTWPTLLMRRDHYHNGRRLWELVQCNTLQYSGEYSGEFC